MHEAPQVDNVAEACMLAGRQERLDALLEQLELCEKALQVSTLTIFQELLPKAHASAALCPVYELPQAK